MTPLTATHSWFDALTSIVREGVAVSPRGQDTHELQHHTLCVDMLHPVVCAPTRKLSIPFMAAEALWIINGDDRVETIAPYNKNIAQFSDDGERFFGAYGPKIAAQMDHVVAVLLSDPSSRQACINLWRENPSQSKDIPCTLALNFSIRDNMLNTHVFMRSNDIWLGTPYDVFNASIISALVCARLNTLRPSWNVRPQTLFLTAASRHLYVRNAARALAVLHNDDQHVSTHPLPDILYRDEQALRDALLHIREQPTSGWWQTSHPAARLRS